MEKIAPYINGGSEKNRLNQEVNEATQRLHISNVHEHNIFSKTEKNTLEGLSADAYLNSTPSGNNDKYVVFSIIEMIVGIKSEFHYMEP